jgi:membrane-bound lytic murein transglycosylase D
MRHNIKYAIIAGITLLLPVALGYDARLFSWGLFNIFADTRFSNEGLSTVENFDPDQDILYLPALKDKNIFQAAGDLSICRKKSVRKYIYLYLTSGREYLIRSIERSFIFEDALRQVFKSYKDIPEELTMLPLLESSFNPLAVSSSKAVGLWQFVDNTARPLGLTRNRWLDERRHIEKSTEAAVKHLMNLRRLFPSWELTLAAYNGGAGYVKRTMERTGEKNFWDLAEKGYLRAETAEYVPKFAALMIIYKNQRLFGIRDEIVIPEKRETGHFTLKKPVDLRDVAQVSGIPIKTLKELNPELNLDVTPPAIKAYRICVPVEAIKKLEENTQELYKNSVSGVIEYMIKRGDTIAKIARAHNKNTDLIIRLNRIKNPNSLQPGTIIYVPI